MVSVKREGVGIGSGNEEGSGGKLGGEERGGGP